MCKMAWHSCYYVIFISKAKINLYIEPEHCHTVTLWTIIHLGSVMYTVVTPVTTHLEFGHVEFVKYPCLRVQVWCPCQESHLRLCVSLLNILLGNDKSKDDHVLVPTACDKVASYICRYWLMGALI